MNSGINSQTACIIGGGWDGSHHRQLVRARRNRIKAAREVLDFNGFELAGLAGTGQ